MDGGKMRRVIGIIRARGQSFSKRIKIVGNFVLFLLLPSFDDRPINFRERQPAGPLHENDGEGRGGFATGGGFPGHAEGACPERYFRGGERAGGQEFEVVGARPVRPVPGFARPRTVRAPFRARRVLRDLPEREPRHRKRRRSLQGAPAGQEGPSSKGEPRKDEKRNKYKARDLRTNREISKIFLELVW